MRRFFTDDLGADGVRLTNDEARHARLALRLKPGDEVTLTDGRGGLRPARVTEVTKTAVELEWTGQPGMAPRPPPLILAPALIRAPRLDEIVRAAAELGFTRLSLFSSERSRASSVGPERLERWRRLAREVAKQTGRPWLPEVDELLDFEGIIDAGANLGCRLILHASPRSGPRTIEQALEGTGPGAGTIIVIGPEGGFTVGEIDQALGRGFTPVTLGPTAFRAETAARIAAVLVWNVMRRG